MKTKLFKTLAATAMSVLAIACAKEPVADNGQQAGVSFEIENPVVISKAGEGTTATQLYYQVFTADGQLIAGLPAQSKPLSSLKTTVTFQLVKDQTYKFIFWAQTPTAGYYSFAGTDDAKDIRTVTANYEGKAANDENFDAFFATESFKVTGPVTKTVTLKRPFAQINIGTKDQLKADDAPAQAIDFTGAKSSVTVKGVPTVFSPLAATPETMLTVPATVTFASAAIPTGLLKVNETDYNYLAMNYVFAPAEGTVCDLSAEIALTGREPIQLSSPTTPIKRNWRTNILGSLLTSGVDFNVVVDPEFEGKEDIHPIIVDGVAYKTLDAAVAAVRVGVQTIIQLNQDMSGNGVKAQDGQDVIIDLGGHTFDVDGELVGSTGTETNGFQLLKGSKVTFRNGTIKSKKAKLLIQNYSDLTLEDVTLDATGGVAQYVLSNNHGQVNVLGTSSILAPEGQHAFDVYYWPPAYKDGVNVYVNTTGTIRGAIEYAKTSDATEEAAEMYASLVIDNAVLENSKFKTSFANPNVKVARSVFADETAAAAWIPTGYNLVTVGDYYIVTSADVTPVASNEGLNTAFNEAANAGKEITVNLSEGTFNWPDSKDGNNVKFPKTINVVGTSKEDCFVKFSAGSYPEDSDVIFENVTIDNAVGCAYNEGSLAQMVRVKDVTVKNCIIKNQFRILAKGIVNIKNCQFINTNSSGFDGYCLNYYGYDGSTVNVENCTFDTVQKAIVIYSEGHVTNYTLNVKDCKFTASDSSTDKAAVQMHTEYGIHGNVTINNCTATGFKANTLSPEGLWWEGKNNVTPKVPTKNFTIKVGGTTVQTAE